MIVQYIYIPIESKCSAGQSEPDTGGSLLTNNENANSANVSAGNTATTGPGMIGSNSSCSAKTPITTTSTPPTVPRSSHQAYSSTGGSGTAPPLAEGQRLLLAAVMTAGSGGSGEIGGQHGDGTGGADGSEHHLAGLLGTSLCGQCCGPICDRYIMKVVDITYHERCLQCTSCSIRLMHSCFMRDGKLYCRFDYER
uniref:LIM zinc-binding domain-containing protein n=1 Tax=Anopheles epiroticus TaxID=199890 RepID=A0A182P5A5_9DIPT